MEHLGEDYSLLLKSPWQILKPKGQLFNMISTKLGKVGGRWTYLKSENCVEVFNRIQSPRIHVWYIYLQFTCIWLIFMVNDGKCR